MAAYKCKMCGGDLTIEPGSSVCECEYCGSKQTVPTADRAKNVEVTVAHPAGRSNPAADSLLKRVFKFLKNEEWERAEEYCEKVLDIDAENADAYLGLLMVQWEISERKELRDQDTPLEQSKYWDELMDYGSPAFIEEIQGYNESIKQRIYDEACDLMAEKTSRGYREAAAAFDGISGWHDAGDKAEACRKLAESTVEQEILHAEQTLPALREKYKKYEGMIACGENHTVAVRADGTVVAVGDNRYGQCNTDGWRDIIAVACGDNHTVGLRSDGTVVAVGQNRLSDAGFVDGRINLSDWKDIVAIACGACYTLGLKSDGRVVISGATGGQLSLIGWKDIVAIACGSFHSIGLRRDGTVVQEYGKNPYTGLYTRGWPTAVSDWKNVVSVSGSQNATIGLCAYGNLAGSKDETGNIVSIGVGMRGGLNLHSDGTVYSVKYYEETKKWRDIVSVASGSYHAVGIKNNGTVIAVGNNSSGACNVSDWRLFESIEDLERARIEIERRKEEERKKAEEARIAEEKRKEEARIARIAELTAKKQQLQIELANTKGLFAGGKRKKLEAEIAAIDAELKKLEK